MKKSRRPARAAKPQAATKVAKVLDEDDLRPPFFADSDPAFLDMGDETPPPLPVARIEKPTESSRLAQAVLALPSFPQRNDADRTRQLLAIYRALDRIAADALKADV